MSQCRHNVEQSRNFFHGFSTAGVVVFMPRSVGFGRERAGKVFETLEYSGNAKVRPALGGEHGELRRINIIAELRSAFHGFSTAGSQPGGEDRCRIRIARGRNDPMVEGQEVWDADFAQGLEAVTDAALFPKLHESRPTDERVCLRVHDAEIAVAAAHAITRVEKQLIKRALCPLVPPAPSKRRTKLAVSLTHRISRRNEILCHCITFWLTGSLHPKTKSRCPAFPTTVRTLYRYRSHRVRALAAARCRSADNRSSRRQHSAGLVADQRVVPDVV